ncbi:Glycoside hydrolase subgroup catalytic core [Macrophomina phaseolina MS6]|uniref:Glycoside hydrolase subgroup catalytic core n=1 Tax=Macrophomina phaseolina (strain MS6) TaxID=1126212 RepID=K2S215_MACPH|nr:Glycoside hydrolase subgroup catalytic core [Macrophomina phaseolina MS6]
MFGVSTLLALAAGLAQCQAQFNNPPGVDIWCGKAYRATNASFNPGGWFVEPEKSSVPLLNFKVKPRMNLYLDGEESGSLLVDASISDLVGQPFTSSTGSSSAVEGTDLLVDIFLDGKSSLLAERTTVSIGDSAEIVFDLSGFSARLEPYNITAIATLAQDNSTTFTANTQFSKLPLRTDNGTVTRLDNLYGGLSVRRADSTTFQPIFPYTYYVQWSLYWYANLSTLDEFSSLGYNLIHIVPTGDLGDDPFPWEAFQPYLDRAAQLGLFFQYDVRWDPSNLTTMRDQVSRLASHPSILLWYTGDEPDGKSNPTNSTRLAYDAIRALDPYHPVSLALNCYDFYYADYAAGAEIILSDVYPVSTNTSWSTVYETPCNATYGCCGCDDCNGAFEDISDRLDVFAHRDEVLGWQKTHWGAPQAFGNETFWTRYPTAAEEVAMNLLSVNHGAKGLVMWNFPVTQDILRATNELAAVLTAEEVGAYLIGAPLTSGLVVSGAERVDAAAWVADGGVLVSVVNLNYGSVAGNITVRLPEGVDVRAVGQSLWGEAEWSVSGSAISIGGLAGLEVSLVELK